MQVRAVAAVVVAGSFLVGAAGCGDNDKESGKSSQQIYSDASTAVQKAKSLQAHVSGTAKDLGGKVTGTLYLEQPDKADITIDAGSAHAELVQIGKQAFVKGDEKFWQNASGSSQLAAAAGKWIVLPADTNQIVPFADPKKLLSDDFDENGKLTKLDTKTVNGAKAVGVRDDKGSVVWVDVTTGRPVQFIDNNTGEGTTTIDFSNWDSVDRTISKPADAIDITKLLGG